jgi:hypothetical protein
MPAERPQARGVVQVANQPQPLQPLLAAQSLLAKHGDSPFWRCWQPRTVTSAAIR